MFLSSKLLLASESPPIDANKITGPHGGLVERSEEFHAEIIADPKLGVLIYLLNAKDLNPLTEQATIYVLLKTKRQELNYYCPPVRHHFQCRVPYSATKVTGNELIVKATRKGKKALFYFKLPLAQQ